MGPIFSPMQSSGKPDSAIVSEVRSLLKRTSSSQDLSDRVDEVYRDLIKGKAIERERLNDLMRKINTALLSEIANVEPVRSLRKVFFGLSDQIAITKH